MYPSGELNRLAAHKAALHLRIGVRRFECARAAAGVERPLAWLDRVVAFWRRISPIAKLAAIPLAVLLKRALLPRAGLFISLLRWTPAIFGAGRAFRALRRQTQS
jgi:hypothetical protein